MSYGIPRYTPLCSRTPLRPGTKRLARSPLNPISAKRRREQPARRRCKARVRERSGGRCEMRVPNVCTGRAEDPHERLPQGRGGDPTNDANVMDGCRACHRWTHDHDDEATALGLLVPSWSPEAEALKRKDHSHGY
jgi:hypothetical protein